MRYAFLATLPCLLLIFGRAMANDLGVVGPTYEIVERDLIEVMKDKFRRMEKSGELARVQENYKQKVIDAVEKPRPVHGVRSTETVRTFYVDPTWTLDRNVVDEQGKLLFPAGTKVNPLDYAPLTQYTLLSSDFDPGPCASLASNPSCQIAESTCISTTPPSLPPGITTSQVAPDGCYQKQNVYACFTGRSDTSECDGYASNPNCTLESSSCNPADKINGQCTFEQKTFHCMSQPGQTNTITDCSGQLFCQNGNCFDKGYTGDTDFARSVALMEAAREAGVYGAETEIFKGFDSRCRIKLFGLANCCKKSSGGGGFSNFNLLGSALSAGGQVLDVGSSYVYDALYDGSTLQQGLGAALGVLGADGLFNPSFSFYGFSFQFLPSQGFIFTGFDPTTLRFEPLSGWQPADRRDGPGASRESA